MADGAGRVLEIGRRERWPLVSIAERTGRADYWFATSMLDVILVQGRRPDAIQSEILTKDLRAGLVLTGDMAGLKASDESQPQFVALTVSPREINQYIKWARTVQ